VEDAATFAAALRACPDHRESVLCGLPGAGGVGAPPTTPGGGYTPAGTHICGPGRREGRGVVAPRAPAGPIKR